MTPREDTHRDKDHSDHNDLSWAEIPGHAFTLDLTPSAHESSAVIDHISNVEYLRFIDRAAEMHSDALGETRSAMAELGSIWFVARHEIDYRAEARAGESLVVATWVDEIARVKAWRRTAIVRPADRVLVLTARTLWVRVNLKTRRPTRIPAAIAERLVAGTPLADVANGQADRT